MAMSNDVVCTSDSASTSSSSSLDQTILQKLLSPVSESIEQEMKWYKSESPNEILKLLTNDKIDSLISCIQSTNEGSLIISQYGYSTRLQMQTIGLIRLSFLLLKMNHASTSSVISFVVQRCTTQSSIQEEQEKIATCDSHQTTVKSLLFLLLHVLQPIAGLTTASATIWRSIGELSRAYPRSAMESRVVPDSIRCLVRDILQPGIISCCSISANSHNGEYKKMVKLLNFFLSRLDSFLQIWYSTFKNVVPPSHVDESKTDVEMFDHLKILISWRGDVGLSSSFDIQSLGRKIDGCLETIISFKRRGGSQTCVIENSQKLEDILAINLSRESSTLAYGLWIFLLHLMEQLYISCVKEPWIDIDTWDLVFSMVENVLLRILPKCHAVIIIEKEHMTLSRSIKVISKLLMFLERCSVLTDANRATKICNYKDLHRKLIKLLGFRDYKTKSIHPISYELVHSIIHLHIIVSHSHSSNGKGYVISHMIQLCSKLIFSDRTSEKLRDNLCCLMNRVISSELPNLKSLCESFLLVEFQNLMLDLKLMKVSKRKRSVDGIHHRWKTLNSNSDLLMLIPKLLGRTFWSRIGESQRETLFKDFEDLLLLYSEDDKRLERIKLLVHQAPLLLSIAVLSLVYAPQEFGSKKDLAFKCILDGLTYANKNSRDQVSLFVCVCSCIKEMEGHINASPSLIQGAFQQLCDRSSTYQKFGIAIVMPHLSVFVNNYAPSAFVKTIQGCFQHLFSSKDHSIAAFAISSLEIFGTQISPQYRHMIPSCIPPTHQSFLQTRIKGGTNIYSISAKSAVQVPGNEVLKWREQEGRMLECLIPKFMESSFKGCIDIGKDFHVFQLSDGSGRSIILLAPPTENSSGIQMLRDVSKWQICQSGNLTTICSQSDGGFKLRFR